MPLTSLNECKWFFGALILSASLIVCSTASFGQPDVNAENARFAARLKSTLLNGAKEAADNLDSQSEKAERLATQIAGLPKLSDQDRKAAEDILGRDVANRLSSRPALAAKSISKISTNASDLANHVRFLTTELENTSPQQALQLLGAGVNGQALAAIFPNRQNTIATVSTPTNALELYGEAGAFKKGGPSIEFGSTALILGWDDATQQFEPACTGTLVAPQKLVTAAHCFCPMPPSGEATKAQCTASESDDPLKYKIFLQQSGIFEVAKVVVNPAYAFGENPNGKYEDRGDVAIVKLKEEPNGVPIAQVAKSIPVGPGTNSNIVGFGGGFAPDAPGIAPVGTDPSPPGIKLWANISLTGCDDPFGTPANLCWSSGPNNVSGSGAICPGDSGGPMFAIVEDRTPLHDRSSLIGINSGGTIWDCTKDRRQGDANLEAEENENFLSAEIGPVTPRAGNAIAYLKEDIDLLHPDGSHPYSFTVDRPLKTLVIAVNGFVRSNLSLEVTTKSGAVACNSEGGLPNKLPSVAVCRMSSAKSHDVFLVTVRGSSQAAYQLLASGFPD